jgi:hypothetical protein
MLIMTRCSHTITSCCPSSSAVPSSLQKVKPTTHTRLNVCILALDSYMSSLTGDANQPHIDVSILLPPTWISTANIACVLRDLRLALLHLESLHVAAAQRKSSSSSAAFKSVVASSSSKRGAPKSFGRQTFASISEKSTATTANLRGAELKVLLQTGLFWLSRMDAHACPSLLLLTDGVLQLNDPALFDNVLANFSYHDIRLAVIQLTAAAFQPSLSLGVVPDAGASLVGKGKRIAPAQCCCCFDVIYVCAVSLRDIIVVVVFVFRLSPQICSHLPPAGPMAFTLTELHLCRPACNTRKCLPLRHPCLGWLCLMRSTRRRW